METSGDLSRPSAIRPEAPSITASWSGKTHWPHAYSGLWAGPQLWPCIPTQPVRSQVSLSQDSWSQVSEPESAVAGNGVSSLFFGNGASIRRALGKRLIGRPSGPGSRMKATSQPTRPDEPLSSPLDFPPSSVRSSDSELTRAASGDVSDRNDASASETWRRKAAVRLPSKRLHQASATDVPSALVSTVAFSHNGARRRRMVGADEPGLDVVGARPEPGPVVVNGGHRPSLPPTNEGRVPENALRRVLRHTTLTRTDP